MAFFATEEEIQEWNVRSDILFHFFAYNFFTQDRPSTTINLVNLTDADIQYYNRTADSKFFIFRVRLLYARSSLGTNAWPPDGLRR